MKELLTFFELCMITFVDGLQNKGSLHEEPVHLRVRVHLKVQGEKISLLPRVCILVLADVDLLPGRLSVAQCWGNDVRW